MVIKIWLIYDPLGENVFPVFHTILLLGHRKMDCFSLQRTIECTLWPASRKYCATGEKMFILRVWRLMPEQSEGSNHARKINGFPVLHTTFFILGGQEMDSFSPQGAIKCTLWPPRRKMFFRVSYDFFLLERRKMDLFSLQQTIKCTLWSASRKYYIVKLWKWIFFRVSYDFFPTGRLNNGFVFPAAVNKMHFIIR